MRSVGALFGAMLALGGCAAPHLAADASKVVRAQPLPPYQIHEECLRLGPGDRVEFRFDSTEPVDFNVHYHEGKSVVMPLVREKSRGDAGIYVAQIAQDYCLMWEAGTPGAVIDYRVRVKPRDS
jgi:hypothetical protein